MNDGISKCGGVPSQGIIPNGPTLSDKLERTEYVLHDTGRLVGEVLFKIHGPAPAKTPDITEVSEEAGILERAEHNLRFAEIVHADLAEILERL